MQRLTILLILTLITPSLFALQKQHDFGSPELDGFYADLGTLSHISKTVISAHADGPNADVIENGIQERFDDSRSRGLSPHHRVQLVDSVGDPNTTAELRITVSQKAGRNGLSILLIDHSIKSEVPELRFVRRGYTVDLPAGMTANEIADTAWLHSVLLLGTIEAAGTNPDFLTDISLHGVWIGVLLHSMHPSFSVYQRVLEIRHSGGRERATISPDTGGLGWIVVRLRDSSLEIEDHGGIHFTIPVENVGEAERYLGRFDFDMRRKEYSFIPASVDPMDPSVGFRKEQGPTNR